MKEFNGTPGKWSFSHSSASDAGEICLKVKIIGLVEHLTSAVRAHGPHGLHEYILSTVGEIKE